MKRILFWLIAAMFLAAVAQPATAYPLVRDDEPKKKDKPQDKDQPKDDEEDDEAQPDDQQSDKDKDEDDEEDDEGDDTPKETKKEKETPKVKESTGKAKEKDKDKKKEEPKKAPTVKRLMEVKLDQFLVPARAINLPMPGRIRTVRDLLERFEKWSKDDDVGAVLLNLDGLSLAIPDVEELRAGIIQLKKNGKKVMAYLSSMDDMGYLIACLADEIAVAPTGGLALPGIGRLFPFMRGRFQMMGIEFDVITAGRYKYPGFLNSREPNKFFTEEINEVFDDWFNDYVQFIVEGRKLQHKAVRDAIDVALLDAQEAKNRGLVDVLAYYDEYCTRVVKRTKYRKVADGESDFSRIASLNDLLNAWNAEVKKARKAYEEVGPKIAVLHARGPIIDLDLGAGLNASLIMRDEFVKTVEEIRKNKTIQAVVLRIDSPGGSGYASDVIWKKLKELDEEKPLVVSMGTVAGSGGYYIACPGRLIYAEPTTLTGSIGVLAILPNQASALNRADINVAELKRGQRSLFGFGHRDLLPADRDFLQKYLLDFYEIFLDRVAASRKMPKDEVRKLAEGRIYTGRQAAKLGLVDRLGTLSDAIGAAREQANIPPSAEIKLVHYPRPSSIGELLFEGMGLNMTEADVRETSPLENALRQAQMPAPVISFDNQLRLFMRNPQPLCWMAMPGVETLLGPPSNNPMTAELLGLPMQPPAPTLLP